MLRSIGKRGVLQVNTSFVHSHTNWAPIEAHADIDAVPVNAAATVDKHLNVRCSDNNIVGQ